MEFSLPSQTEQKALNKEEREANPPVRESKKLAEKKSISRGGGMMWYGNITIIMWKQLIFKSN